MRIYTRQEWKSTFDYSQLARATTPAGSIYLHHSVSHAGAPTFDDDTPSNEQRAMQALEKIGTERFGQGISYTYAVFPSGRVYEGHPVGKRGSHTKGFNTVGRGIVAVGNFEVQLTTDRLLESIAQLAVEGFKRDWWTDKTYLAHRDVPDASTACCGKNLYAQVPNINKRITALFAPASTTPAPKPTVKKEEKMQRLVKTEEHNAVFLTDGIHYKWEKDQAKLAFTRQLTDNDVILVVSRDWLDDQQLVGFVPPGW